MADVHANVIQAFVTGPEYIIRYEEHNLQLLKQLVKTANILKSDRDLLNKHIYPFKDKIDETIVIEVKYDKKASRYTAPLPLLSLSQSLKAKVFEDYEYLDIVNRNYCILYELSRIYNIEVPAIQAFVQNYANICEEYLSSLGGAQKVKNKFAKIAFQ